MPLLQPPAPDLRSSELTYTHAYNSIVSRVHRASGSGSGGVVILAGVDVVSLAVIPFPHGVADGIRNRTACWQLGYYPHCSNRTMCRTDSSRWGGTLSWKLNETKPSLQKRSAIDIPTHKLELTLRSAAYPDTTITWILATAVKLLHSAGRLSPTYHRFASPVELAKPIRARCE